ncbi:MAG: hypothetical protein AAF518_23380 [Spirochaetota bacterium]
MSFHAISEKALSSARVVQTSSELRNPTQGGRKSLCTLRPPSSISSTLCELYLTQKETTMEETDYKALFDRMEILIDRLSNTKHRKKLRKKYKKLMHRQLKFLRAQLE